MSQASPGIAELMARMIAFSEGNLHDIDHFIRVWTYAKTIGELEGLDGETQFILELAAITHDIACPLCRAKYGNTNGKHQEAEGAVLVRDFLGGFDLSPAIKERVAWLVGHHHSFTDVQGLDHQILLEADYLANASENGWSKHKIRLFRDRFMRTESGKRLAQELFQL